MSSESNAMSGYKSAEEWVDSKYTMGEDVVFDGYQSSSSEKGGISSFAAENGVVFEILTPEGANITEISNYEQECETLLPRNARYKVVGIEKNVRITLQKRSTGLYGNTIVRLVAVNSKGEVLDGTNADEITPVDELENRRNNKQEETL